MNIYLNTQTKEYPRHPGDLELLGWVQGTPLPLNWVQVIETDALSFEDGETVYEVEPLEVDGVWSRQWAVRALTQEEIEQNANPPKVF